MDELTESNRRFNARLKDAVEAALGEGDDDLCSVHVGRMFVRAEEDMMAAFKSYCTRQVSHLRSTLLLRLGYIWRGIFVHL